MYRKTDSTILMLTLLLIGILTLAFGIKPVKGNGIPIGEWFSDDRIAICIHSFQTASRIDYFPYEPDTPGYIWAWVDISIKNVGTEEISTNTLYAHLKDSQGYVYERTRTTDPKHLKLMDLPPGGTIRGTVYFEIPPDATIVAFIWYNYDSYIEIPEFSSLMVLSLIIMIVSIATVIARKKYNQVSIA